MFRGASGAACASLVLSTTTHQRSNHPEGSRQSRICKLPCLGIIYAASCIVQAPRPPRARRKKEASPRTATNAAASGQTLQRGNDEASASFISPAPAAARPAGSPWGRATVGSLKNAQLYRISHDCDCSTLVRRVCELLAAKWRLSACAPPPILLTTFLYPVPRAPSAALRTSDSSQLFCLARLAHFLVLSIPAPSARAPLAGVPAPPAVFHTRFGGSVRPGPCPRPNGHRLRPRPPFRRRGRHGAALRPRGRLHCDQRRGGINAAPGGSLPGARLRRDLPPGPVPQNLTAAPPRAAGRRRRGPHRVVCARHVWHRQNSGGRDDSPLTREKRARSQREFRFCLRL